MTAIAPRPIEVINGRFGSSEKVAVHLREVSSGQVTVMAVAVDVTATGPGRTSVASNVIVCAATSDGTRTNARTRQFLFMCFPPTTNHQPLTTNYFFAFHSSKRFRVAGFIG